MSRRTSLTIGDPALSARKAPRGCAPGCFAGVFAVVFLGAGCATFFFLALRPWFGMLQARSWTPTPCTVVSSDVKANDDSLQLTVVFKYTVNQQEYQSDTYCFTSMSSNTANRWKRQVVKDHPAGKQTTCFVNPNDPTEAVIERGWVPDMWWGFFPIPFLLVGVAALLVALGVIRLPRTRAGTAASNWKPAVSSRQLPMESDESESDSDSEEATESTWAEDSGDSDGPVTLQPSSTPLGSFLGVLFFSVLWNGIVSVFVWQMYQAYQRGGFAAVGWFQTLFLTPFVLVGLVLVLGVFYTFLTLFNPRPTLIVSSQSVPLGDELQLRWTVSGRVSSIKRLRILLKGIEKATYRRGTSTYTDEATFAEIPLVETYEEFEITEGSATATIPADSMHSFAASNNKIEWSLIVQGDIQLWPDMSATFPITVLPQRPQESA